MSIDIIIPAYNAKKNIYKTLFSIAIQKKISNFCVYIVNDNSAYDYSTEVNFFKSFFNIKELKLKKNMGPGYAREFGIKNSNSEYIIFIDSDDYLYDPYSIYMLYNEIIKGYDIVVSNFLYERDNEKKFINKSFIWLHGKIFRRSFLKQNNIHFNNSRSNEDNGFNRLCLFNNPNIAYLDKTTYIYSENSNSITRKNNRMYKFTGLKGLVYNLNWAMNIAIRKNLNEKLIFDTALNLLIAMYYYYLEFYNNDKYNVNKIIYWCIDTKKIFNTYKSNYFNIDIFNKCIGYKKEEYKDKNINIIINFDEFLNKIDEVTK